MRPFNDEVMDDRVADILRHKTPAEKLKMLSDMWQSAWGMIINNLRREHPDWSEEQLRRETARRMSKKSDGD